MIWSRTRTSTPSPRVSKIDLEWTRLKLQDSRNAISHKELMIGARMERAEDDIFEEAPQVGAGESSVPRVNEPAATS